MPLALVAFVVVRAVAGELVLDLRYATPDNVTHRALYDRAECILRQPVADALHVAAKRVAAAGYQLLIHDCFRPQDAQVALASVESDPRYVADPKRGSRHTRGAAIDLSLVDREGHAVEMPSAWDESGPRAHRDRKDMSPAARRHLTILEDAMRTAGFVGLRTEWWHYDFASWRQFPLVPTGWPAPTR